MIIHIPRPFPISSSIYSQKNCMTNTNRVTKKVTTKGPTKLRIISLSSFFIKRGNYAANLQK